MASWGEKLAPRLLSELGSDRSLFQSAQALQGYVGTAPVSFQSGQVCHVYVRFMCNQSFRHALVPSKLAMSRAVIRPVARKRSARLCR